MATRTLSIAAAVVSLVVASALLAQAQETLERTPALSGGWVGQNGVGHLNVPYRFTTRPGTTGEVVGSPTFELSLGLPWHALAGGRFAHQSPTVPARPNEWEIFARRTLLGEDRGAPLDLGLSAGFNGAARSLDGEMSLARWTGPLRLLGAARVMSDGYGSGDPRIALAGGAVLHPAPGRLPLAVAADAASLLDRGSQERLAWSAAVQLGLSFTDHTLSVFVTNTGSSTLQGLSRGDDRVRLGFELTIPIPAGRFVGWFVSREEARRAVVEPPDAVDRVVRAEATRYLFSPKRIEIGVGTVIEWTNNDTMVHTVTAEDGSWNSGAIAPGETWRARFDAPGTYPFLCAPHPFMKGVVIVR
jgi:plastocyanin